jgi:hypothetical protein
VTGLEEGAGSYGQEILAAEVMPGNDRSEEPLGNMGCIRQFRYGPLYPLYTQGGIEKSAVLRDSLALLIFVYNGLAREYDG